jgi:hypothetical protein
LQRFALPLPTAAIIAMPAASAANAPALAALLSRSRTMPWPVPPGRDRSGPGGMSSVSATSSA